MHKGQSACQVVPLFEKEDPRAESEPPEHAPRCDPTSAPPCRNRGESQLRGSWAMAERGRGPRPRSRVPSQGREGGVRPEEGGPVRPAGWSRGRPPPAPGGPCRALSGKRSAQISKWPGPASVSPAPSCLGPPHAGAMASVAPGHDPLGTTPALRRPRCSRARFPVAGLGAEGLDQKDTPQFSATESFPPLRPAALETQRRTGPWAAPLRSAALELSRIDPSEPPCLPGRQSGLGRAAVGRDEVP